MSGKGRKGEAKALAKPYAPTLHERECLEGFLVRHKETAPQAALAGAGDGARKNPGPVSRAR